MDEIEISSFNSCEVAKANADERLKNGYNSSFSFSSVSQIIDETKDSYALLLNNYLKQINLQR
jgi:hypothetical protein